MTRSSKRIGVFVLLVGLTAPAASWSQVYSGAGNRYEVFVGTETEQYLRYLSLTDTTINGSWSIRPLSPSQIQDGFHTAGSHPWQSRLAGLTRPNRAIELGLVSPNASVRLNTAFPYGSNDGAIWAGRGLTIAAQAGVYARVGPVSLTLAPTFFRAQNAQFPLAPSGIACGCGEPLQPSVDRPQRFGTQPYQRLDPGQSSIRVDAVGVSAGFSTASEGWGPLEEYPFLLGNNAPGFPHFFAGSSAPFPVLIGRAHARVIYGRLDQSEFSPESGPKFYTSRLQTGRVRFGSGIVLSFQPRGIDGLEIGVSRFIHSIWPRSGIPPSYLKKPLQSFLKSHLSGIDQQVAGTDNQLASAFGRWVFAKSGLEVYGEYGREDHNYDLRDLVQEPDHQRSYAFGLAKIIGKSPTQFSVLRLEVMNFEFPPLTTTGRGEGGLYTHSPMIQGHTNRGQLLGADVGVGAAAGSTLRWDRYSTRGRWAVFWRRNVRQEVGDPSLASPSSPQGADVLHAIGFERLKFTRRFDITTSVTLMRDFSRNFSNSRFNANAAVAVTLPR